MLWVDIHIRSRIYEHRSSFLTIVILHDFSRSVRLRQLRGNNYIFHEKSLPYSPMNRAAIVFMISLVPAKIRVTRMSRQARAIGYSSQ